MVPVFSSSSAGSQADMSMTPRAANASLIFIEATLVLRGRERKQHGLTSCPVVQGHGGPSAVAKTFENNAGDMIETGLTDQGSSPTLRRRQTKERSAMTSPISISKTRRYAFASAFLTIAFSSTACDEGVAEGYDSDFSSRSDLDDGVCTAAEVEVNPDPTQGDPETCLEDEYFNHPMQYAALADGRVPLLDVKNSASGRRYAIQESGDEHGHQSGVVELARRQMTDAERRELEDEKDLTPIPVRAVPRLGDELIARAASADPGSTIRTEVSLERGSFVTFTDRLWRRIANGEIENEADKLRVAEEIQQEIRDEVGFAVDEAAAQIEALGGKIVGRCENGFCLTVDMPAERVASLESIAIIARADAEAELSNADDSDWDLFNQAYQNDQFWNQGLDGENAGGGGTDITFAITELGGYRTTHRAFREGTGTSTRIRGMYNCGSSSCSSQSGWSSPTFHATGAASAVFGDLTDNQQSGLTNTEERERSGGAREARGYLYKVNAHSSAANKKAFDHLNSRSPKPQVLSYSIPNQSNQNCDGESTREKDADNLLYEQGVLMVAAAGNSGQSTTDCRVWSPGAAAGVFTVGGFAGNSTYTNPASVRTAGLNSNSSSGGVDSSTYFSEGKRRSVIDIVGSYHIRRRASETSDTGYKNFSGTSVAAPSIAGAALNVIDMYNTEISNFIDNNPGYLAAWLLAMGDREAGSYHMSTRFNRNWGAGRLRMRTINAAGMDSPWYWYGGSTCVDDNETVTININGGNTVSSDVDTLNAVVWWYDRRLESSNNIDDIDLTLRTGGGSYLTGSSDRYDNKERVYRTFVGGQSLKLEISGYDVTSDNEGCGNNSMRVYYAMLLEDADRDDGDGPSYNASTGVGVAPW